MNFYNVPLYSTEGASTVKVQGHLVRIQESTETELLSENLEKRATTDNVRNPLKLYSTASEM